jgi:hypothetical protein
MLTWQVSPHIYYRSYEPRGVVILDVEEGEWVVLNELASELWRNWAAGTGTDDAVRTVAARHPGTSPEDIRADALHLHDDLVRRRYLRAAAPGVSAAIQQSRAVGDVPLSPSRSVGAAMAAPPAGTARPRPGWFRRLLALVFITLAHILLRISFRGCLALVQGSRRSWCRDVLPPDGASRTVDAVQWAARWFPGRAACLEQSLAAVLLALVARRRLDWCLGSAPDPYRFHAWVAVDGKPVTRVDDDPALDQNDLILTA